MNEITLYRIMWYRVIALEKIITVTMDGREVGCVTLTPVGLYYNLFCFCDTTVPAQMHLISISQDKSLDLGPLKQDKQGTGLKRLIPAKQIGDNPSFILQEHSENFIPLLEGMPFHYLDRLMDARFVRKKGQVGIFFSPDHRCQ